MSKSDWIKTHCKFAAWPESLGPGEEIPSSPDVPPEMPPAPAPEPSTEPVQHLAGLAQEALEQAQLLLRGGKSDVFESLEEALDTAQMYAREAYRAAISP